MNSMEVSGISPIRPITPITPIKRDKPKEQPQPQPDKDKKKQGTLGVDETQAFQLGVKKEIDRALLN